MECKNAKRFIITQSDLLSGNLYQNTNICDMFLNFYFIINVFKRQIKQILNLRVIMISFILQITIFD